MNSPTLLHAPAVSLTIMMHDCSLRLPFCASIQKLGLTYSASYSSTHSLVVYLSPNRIENPSKTTILAKPNQHLAQLKEAMTVYQQLPRRLS